MGEVPIGDAMVNRFSHPKSTARVLDPKAPAIVAKGKRKNIREFATLHTWRFKNWIGNKIAGRK